MFNYLFDVFGWDDGGPISQYVQGAFRLALQVHLPRGWQVEWVESQTHNPRPTRLVLPDGVEINLYAGMSQEGLPEEFRGIIETFLREDIPQLLGRLVAAGDEAQRCLDSLDFQPADPAVDERILFEVQPTGPEAPATFERIL